MSIGQGAEEVEDPELLNMPIEGVDVYVSNKEVDGKTLAEVGADARCARRIPAENHARRGGDLDSYSGEHDDLPR